MSYSNYVYHLEGAIFVCLIFLISTQPAYSASGLYDFATQYPGFGQVQDIPIQSVISPVQMPVVTAPEKHTSNSGDPVPDAVYSPENPEYADRYLSGFYIGGRVLLSAAHVLDEELTNGRGFEFHQKGKDVDTVFGLGFLAGYDWHEQDLPIRAELEYAYRIRHDFNTEEVGPWQGLTKLKDIGYKNDLSTHSLMLSIFYDFSTASRWKPYIGAGAGWARNTSSTMRKPNDSSEPRQTIENDTDNLAFSFQTGVRVILSSDWVGELGYRFIDFGKIESGTFSGGDYVSAEHLLSHDLVMGISYLY